MWLRRSRLHLSIALWPLLLASCRGPCPKCPAPPPPRVVMADPVRCNLPDLPESIRFKPSSEDGAAVLEQVDLADLVADIDRVLAWVEAVIPCLEANQ
jgi:hypothetical protein